MEQIDRIVAKSSSEGLVSTSLGAQSYNIAALVSVCLQYFDELEDLIKHSDNEYQAQIEPNEVMDELGRFQAWAGNISAHRRGRSSLDYRLRDASHIKEKARMLISDLTGLIHRSECTSELVLQTIANDSQTALQIFRGERIPWDKRTLQINSDSEVTDSEIESDPDSSDGETELRQLMTSIHDTITFLLRLSMAIRNPAPYDQYMNSAKISTSHFQHFDIKHVEEKFPEAPKEVAIALGKAISRRREYFKYRESHNKKLSDGLIAIKSAQNIEKEIDQDAKTKSIPLSTIASSIPQEVKAKDYLLELEADQHSDSGQTQTSFATTAAGSQSRQAPDIPKEAREGNPFPCPFCFLIISVNSKRSWKKHVLKDLQPYSCTFPSCLNSKKLFERRHEWFQHEIQFHRRFWHCIEGCQAQFQSKEGLERHLMKHHDSCAVPQGLVRLTTSGETRPNMRTITRCILCGQGLELRELERHLGRHQKQLALFALPDITGDEAEDSEEAEEREGSGLNSVCTANGDAYTEGSSSEALESRGEIDTEVLGEDKRNRWARHPHVR